MSPRIVIAYVIHSYVERLQADNIDGFRALHLPLNASAYKVVITSTNLQFPNKFALLLVVMVPSTLYVYGEKGPGVHISL
jgi:hypothetical protein